jgi:hypothetical protein
MAAPPGYNPTPLIPSAGGVIHAMHGGGDGGAPPHYNPNPITPYVNPSSAPILNYSGGGPNDLVTIAVGAVATKEANSAATTATTTAATTAATTAPKITPKATPIAAAIAAAGAATTVLSNESSNPLKKQITLNGRKLTLEKPWDFSEGSTATEALAWFGVDKTSDEMLKGEVLQALFDGVCDTDKPLIMVLECEPIRRLIQSLAEKLLGNLTRPVVKNTPDVIASNELQSAMLMSFNVFKNQCKTKTAKDYIENSKADIVCTQKDTKTEIANYTEIKACGPDDDTQRVYLKKGIPSAKGIDCIMDSAVLFTYQGVTIVNIGSNEPKVLEEVLKKDPHIILGGFDSTSLSAKGYILAEPSNKDLIKTDSIWYKKDQDLFELKDTIIPNIMVKSDQYTDPISCSYSDHNPITTVIHFKKTTKKLLSIADEAAIAASKSATIAADLTAIGTLSADEESGLSGTKGISGAPDGDGSATVVTPGSEGSAKIGPPGSEGSATVVTPGGDTGLAVALTTEVLPEHALTLTTEASTAATELADTVVVALSETSAVSTTTATEMIAEADAVTEAHETTIAATDESAKIVVPLDVKPYVQQFVEAYQTNFNNASDNARDAVFAAMLHRLRVRIIVRKNPVQDTITNSKKYKVQEKVYIVPIQQNASTGSNLDLEALRTIINESISDDDERVQLLNELDTMYIKPKKSKPTESKPEEVKVIDTNKLGPFVDNQIKIIKERITYRMNQNPIITFDDSMQWYKDFIAAIQTYDNPTQHNIIAKLISELELKTAEYAEKYRTSHMINKNANELLVSTFSNDNLRSLLMRIKDALRATENGYQIVKKTADGHLITYNNASAAKDNAAAAAATAAEHAAKNPGISAATDAATDAEREHIRLIKDYERAKNDKDKSSAELAAAEKVYQVAKNAIATKVDQAFEKAIEQKGSVAKAVTAINGLSEKVDKEFKDAMEEIGQNVEKMDFFVKFYKEWKHLPGIKEKQLRTHLEIQSHADFDAEQRAAILHDIEQRAEFHRLINEQTIALFHTNIACVTSGDHYELFQHLVNEFGVYLDSKNLFKYEKKPIVETDCDIMRSEQRESTSANFGKPEVIKRINAAIYPVFPVDDEMLKKIAIAAVAVLLQDFEDDRKKGTTATTSKTTTSKVSSLPSVVETSTTIPPPSPLPLSVNNTLHEEAPPPPTPPIKQHHARRKYRNEIPSYQEIIEKSLPEYKLVLGTDPNIQRTLTVLDRIDMMRDKTYNDTIQNQAELSAVRDELTKHSKNLRSKLLAYVTTPSTTQNDNGKEIGRDKIEAILTSTMNKLIIELTDLDDTLNGLKEIPLEKNPLFNEINSVAKSLPSASAPPSVPLPAASAPASAPLPAASAPLPAASAPKPAPKPATSPAPKPATSPAPKPATSPAPKPASKPMTNSLNALIANPKKAPSKKAPLTPNDKIQLELTDLHNAITQIRPQAIGYSGNSESKIATYVNTLDSYIAQLDEYRSKDITYQIDGVKDFIKKCRVTLDNIYQIIHPIFGGKRRTQKKRKQKKRFGTQKK